MKKLRVYAADKSDIAIRRKAAMDQYISQKNRYNSERKAYLLSQQQFEASVENMVRRELGEYSQYVQVRVTPYYGTGLEVKIGNGDNPFQEGQALAWSATTHLNRRGEVELETSSWSGLRAATARELDDLKRTVAILDVIQNMDWKGILSQTGPKYEDYVSTVEPIDPSRQFDLEEANMGISEAVGQRVLLLGKNPEGRGSRGWYQIVAEGPKTYTVKFRSQYDVGGADADMISRLYDNARARRIPKDQISKFIQIPTKEMTF